MLHYHANGIDQSKVEPPSPPRSISQETTFDEDTSDQYFLEAMLRYLSEKVGAELRRQNRQARCITLKLRYFDFKTITRSHTLKAAGSSDQVIFEAALQLLETALSQQNRPVRLIGIRVSELVGAERQLPMLDSSTEKLEQIGRAIDHIRQRHGFGLIQTGRTLSFKRTSPARKKNLP
jgi:DNA polymerase-4